ncbi:MAG TPA: NAD(P)H-dependent glycerol-3-phosphate dehydrogenase [Xanthobacteraceae bacterium]|nr:NAD(P)H-dependent glycerol-3-phosphate dehydrogenase [Xanthobacteraceae bacterium]
MAFDHIGILGAGAWGTALAGVAQRAGRRVTLWLRNDDKAARLQRTRESEYLAGIKLDPRIAVTAGLAEAAASDAVLLAVPAQSLRGVGGALRAYLAAGTPVIACAKGIERGSRKFMTEVIAETVPQARPAILSGPSFAAEVARGLPAAVTLAAHDEDLAADLSAALHSPTFRPYQSTDVRGVEIGGATKNVLAIAAGIVAGRGLGASAAAALTTRGFAELSRLGKALGARPETLVGLSGLGDLILTCSSEQSRNFSLGLALGRGTAPKEAAAMTKLAEGVFTASVVAEMAQAAEVEMPICAAVAAVVDGRLDLDQAIQSLLMRPVGME